MIVLISDSLILGELFQVPAMAGSFTPGMPSPRALSKENLFTPPPQEKRNAYQRRGHAKTEPAETLEYMPNDHDGAGNGMQKEGNGRPDSVESIVQTPNENGEPATPAELPAAPALAAPTEPDANTQALASTPANVNAKPAEVARCSEQ